MTKFFIDQHGCAKNQVDGELIVTRLLNLGMSQTFDAADADFIIVNSCGFIESAKKESLDAVYYAKNQYPNAKILLTGCLAERYSDDLREQLPEADAIFGNGNLDKIDETVKAMLKGERCVNTYSQEGVCVGERRVLLSYRGSAFVKITEGCSNHCSFCAIPVIRGELRSRPALSIINEIKELHSKGVVEFNLIGQDLAAYGTGENDDVFGTGRLPLPRWENGKNCGTEEKSGLARLLEMISALPGNFAVRPLYIHPDHFNRDILPVMRKDKRLLPYFDIPFQSGSENIIHKMNRKGSAAEYLRLASDIREALPGASLRTTFLTGFPGETDADAAETVEFLKKLKSDWSGCFPYSREEDTPAYSMKNRVKADVAKRRAGELVSVQAEITRQSLAARVGGEYDVLIEEIVEGDEGLAIGRAWFQAPEVDGSVVVRYEKDSEGQRELVKTGRFVKVRLVASSDVDLDAILTGESELNAGVAEQKKEGLIYATEIRD